MSQLLAGGPAPSPGWVGAPTRLPAHPRWEGANIGTWLGFKHLNYLVEEAVLDHLRQHGLGPARLFREYGLCLELVALDTRIRHALHVDDRPVAAVSGRRGGRAGRLEFDVTIEAPVAPEDPASRSRRAVSASVAAVLRRDVRVDAAAQAVPAELASYLVDRIGDPRAGAPVDPRQPLAGLTRDRNAFGWRMRIPYFYCHFTERMRMSGYLRVVEEVVDRFLADRGVSVKRLLDERDWIPAVPHSRIGILAEARMEEELLVAFTVQRIFKRLTFDASVDCYVLRDGRLVPTATGRITHGYAHLDGRADWHLVDFDDRLMNALSSGEGAPG